MAACVKFNICKRDEVKQIAEFRFKENCNWNSEKNVYKIYGEKWDEIESTFP